MEIFILFVLVGVALFVLGLLAEIGKKNPGLLYLLAIPLAIITLPFKLALDMMGSSRRGRRRRRR